MSKCSFCGSTELIKAHIIPKAFITNINRESGSAYHLGGGKLKKTQHSAFDKAIFCKSCDSKMGEFENALSKLSKKPDKYLKKYHEKNGLILYQIDRSIGKKVHLAFLSIILKSSLTKNANFKSFYIGKSHEDNIKKIIYDNEDEILREYPMVLFKLRVTIAGFDEAGIYCTPYRIRSDGINCVRISLGGFRAFLKMDQRCWDRHLTEGCFPFNNLVCDHTFDESDKEFRAFQQIVRDCR